MLLQTDMKVSPIAGGSFPKDGEITKLQMMTNMINCCSVMAIQILKKTNSLCQV